MLAALFGQNKEQARNERHEEKEKNERKHVWSLNRDAISREKKIDPTKREALKFSGMV